MSNFAVGTLVYLRCPPELATEALPNGAFGAVVNGSPWHNYIPMGNVVVCFRAYPSPTSTGLWHVPTKYLVEISDPDADVDESTDKMIDKYFEEHA